MKSATNLLTAVALIAALASGALFFLIRGQKEKLLEEKNNLAAELANWQGSNSRLSTELNAMKGENAMLITELKSATERVKTLESKFEEATRNLQAIQLSLETASSSLKALEAERDQLKEQNKELEDKIAAPNPGAMPAAVREKIAKLERDNAQLRKALGNKLVEGDPVPYINTSVATVGPKSAFVVLNAGSRAGLKTDMKVAIERNSQIIAQASISQLEENLAVAQVIPNTLASPVQPGDSAYTVN